MRKRKAPKLPIQKRLAIARWKEKYPKATFYEIAEEFNCTYDQARQAWRDYIDGKLTRRKPTRKKINVEDIMTKDNADEILERQYHRAVAELEATNSISVEERVGLLEDLFSMRKILQQIKLENYIKRIDAGVIRILIRRYEPEATDDDVIRIYLESVEKWKLENQ